MYMLSRYSDAVMISRTAKSLVSNDQGRLRGEWRERKVEEVPVVIATPFAVSKQEEALQHVEISVSVRD
jgi:hypothetical protein